MTAQDRLAPVDAIVIEFPAGELTPQGFVALLDLVNRDVIHILDLEFVVRESGGSVHLVDIEDAVRDAVALEFLVGASSGILDEDDVKFVGEQIEPGSLAAVVLFEHAWLPPLVDALGAGRARIVAAAHVDPDSLSAALAEPPVQREGAGA